MSGMKPIKELLYIVIHASSTRVNQKVTVEDIDRWYRARGWNGCGYHWVILQDGTIQPSRPENMAGAHVEHYNEHAIGVCYIGGIDEKGHYADTRTQAQKTALWHLLCELRLAYPNAKIVGHRDFLNAAKLCPLFDCQTEYLQLNT